MPLGSTFCKGASCNSDDNDDRDDDTNDDGIYNAVAELPFLARADHIASQMPSHLLKKSTLSHITYT